MKRPVDPVENWIEAREKRIAQYNVPQQQIFKSVKPPGCLAIANELSATQTEEIHGQEDLHIRWMDITQDLTPLNPIVDALRRDCKSRLAGVPLDILQYVLNPYMCAFATYGNSKPPPADNPRLGITWDRTRICLPGSVQDCVHPDELVVVPASSFEVIIGGVGVFDIATFFINADNTWMVDGRGLTPPDALFRVCNGAKCLLFCRRKGFTKGLNNNTYGPWGCSLDTGLISKSCVFTQSAGRQVMSQHRDDVGARTEVELRGILSNTMHDRKCPMTRGRVFSPEAKCSGSCLSVTSRRPQWLKVLAMCMDARGTVCVAFVLKTSEYIIAVVRADGNIAYRFLAATRPRFMQIDARGDLVVIGTPWGFTHCKITVYHIGMPI